MKIIGITGGIGVGKSEVLNYLATTYDCTVVQADQVSHFLMTKGQSCYQPVITLLGDEIVRADGELDRKRIAALVYADAQLLTSLNELVHPAVEQYIRQMLDNEHKQGRKYFFIEAALLLEAHYDEICDELWYIHADVAVRRTRLKNGRGYQDEQIDKIMKEQLQEETFIRRCDVTINNSGNFEETRIQIDSRM